MRSHSQRTRRMVGLLAALAITLGISAVPRAEANTPCGYVRYKVTSGGTWHQVPHVPYCEPDDWCGGASVYFPPDQVLLLHYETYVCVPVP